MKKVLIALDYNPSAQKVAETGYALAKNMQASVVLLHVLADPGYYAAYQYSPIMGFDNTFIRPETQPPDMSQEIESAAMEFLNRSKAHLGADNINVMVRDGNTADQILEAATAENADVIVLGSHSRSGLDKILMGSVTGKVLQGSAIPLFIIPTKESSAR